MKIEIAVAPAVEVRAAFALHEVIRVDGDVVGAITALAPSVPDPLDLVHHLWRRLPRRRRAAIIRCDGRRVAGDRGRAFGHETR